MNKKETALQSMTGAGKTLPKSQRVNWSGKTETAFMNNILESVIPGYKQAMEKKK